MKWSIEYGEREKQKEFLRVKQYAYQIKALYGLTIEEYNKLLAVQKGVCAICKCPSRKRLVVDHCHNTNRVRGLLCGACNIGLGMFGDDEKLFLSAISYLKR